MTIAKLWARHIGILAPPACALPTHGGDRAASVHALTYDAAANQGVSGFVLSVLIAKAALMNATAAATADALLRQLWVALSAATLTMETPGSQMNLMHVPAALVASPAELDVRAAATAALSEPKGLAGVLQFPRPAHIAERFDICFVLRCRNGSALQPAANDAADSASPAASPVTTDAEDIQFPGGRRVAFSLATTLRTALHDRLKTARVACNHAGDIAYVALSYTSEGAGRDRLVRGPPVEHRDDVAAFDALWGAKMTSSRQFADGGVFRCVVWPSESKLPPHAEALDARGTVRFIHDLVQHLIARHHYAADGANAPFDIRCFDMDLLDVLCEPTDGLGATWGDATPLAGPAIRAVVEKAAGFVRQACTESFPCVIKSIDAVTGNARDTDVFPTLPHASIINLSSEGKRTRDVASLLERKYVALEPTITPIHVAVIIDDKNKIPDTIEAISVMKGAIAAQLAKALTGVAGDDVRVLCAKSSVDVLIDGFVVRLHLGHYREVSLMRALNREPEALALERRMFRAPQHARFIRSVTSTHLTAAPAMRLLKRWVGASLMSDYLLPEAAELLVAAVYQQAGWIAGGAHIPMSATSAFLRALRLLADSASLARAPIVLSNAAADVRAAEIAYRKARDENPELGFFIAAPYVVDESPYTFNTPRSAMLERLALLATRSLQRFAESCGAAAVATVAQLARAEDSVVAAVFAAVDCHSFDAALPFTAKIRMASSTAMRVPCVLADDGGRSMLRPGARWEVHKNANLPLAILGRHLAPMVERDLAGTAVRAIRGACRDEALFFYDSCSPTAIGVSLLRKRKQPLPEDWSLSHGLAMTAVPVAATQGAFTDVVPAALIETATVIKKALEAAAGSVVSPNIMKQVYGKPAEKKVTAATPAHSPSNGNGKRPRPSAEMMVTADETTEDTQPAPPVPTRRSTRNVNRASARAHAEVVPEEPPAGGADGVEPAVKRNRAERPSTVRRSAAQHQGAAVGTPAKSRVASEAVATPAAAASAGKKAKSSPRVRASA
jgi:hypothetical protein